MSEATVHRCLAPATESARWTPAQLASVHALPLGRVLELLAATEEHQAVERMLGLLCTTVGAGPALAIEYVLHGGVLKVRQVVAPAFGRLSAGEIAQGVADSLIDPAHGHLVALARGLCDDAMFGLRSAVEPPARWLGHFADGSGLCERISVLYTLAPNTAWAMHLFPSTPGDGLGAEALQAIQPCGLLVREAHRIVSPTEPGAGQRVDSAEVRLSVRAASLSGRERQICARIADGQSAALIAAELGIAASTVTTLRKRAYAKLGIHDRMDLRHLAA
ncbi:helix-turn-helix transcriptional regulator [Hydrogenophaga pseudoflava]|uniref:helix-turn-helix transcriptional regulator n=1 Tax=Hydrogenophaga pseudoflava TaxID=47421 RepID=UPI0027E5A4CB|nr:helix-turn-helix transcriptional regulator [Hydrogenophaga pseudoflava]MDQ7747322.1 helix-turn-helix transcriptional regulator [Hydrogenophaga pseudoflava]